MCTIFESSLSAYRNYICPTSSLHTYIESTLCRGLMIWEYPADIQALSYTWDQLNGNIAIYMDFLNSIRSFEPLTQFCRGV